MNASDVFGFSDAFGPAKVIHVYEPSVGLKAILVVDNIARGPAIGGARMAPDVSLEECFRLARSMTFKNAAADLPHGGGKSVIFGDPKMPMPQKEKLIRAFASCLRNERDYIFAPDMGTDEDCMAWIQDEIGRAAGLPRDIGGIPLDEIGATGWGIYQVADVAAGYCNLKLDGARIVIQGFGAVGQHSARFLNQAGAILVGVSDSGGAVYDPRGLDVSALIALKKTGKSVSDGTAGQKLPREAVIDIACDIWIPAARPDVINAANVSRLKTKLIVEGANIPVTPEAEKLLHAQGVLCVPDFIANAGGVICAVLEYRGATQSMVFSSIEEKVRANTERVLEAVATKGIPPRQAALELAEARVRKAMSYRRWSLFSSAADRA
jgi:glutamate dehydrogenase (NAD(P)+)